MQDAAGLGPAGRSGLLAVRGQAHDAAQLPEAHGHGRALPEVEDVEDVGEAPARLGHQQEQGQAIQAHGAHREAEPPRGGRGLRLGRGAVGPVPEQRRGVEARGQEHAASTHSESPR
ncbi:unnamed protein product [Prorocentrum cordatum]|uniref:Uncharacterized protein n=1 Tax=Prorocentrum cordatum TaxID=2364126 RepID=A0ABN9VYG8_9DINO|nr:unnamed protein product [Polarella glacialis]